MKYLKYGEMVDGKEQVKCTRITLTFNHKSLKDPKIFPWKIYISPIDSESFLCIAWQLDILKNVPWKTFEGRARGSILFENILLTIDENGFTTISLV